MERFMDSYFINQQYLKNYPNLSANSNIQSANTPIAQSANNESSDVFVKTGTKQIKTTPIIVAAAMLALGGIALLKQHNISKIKKLITAEYDKMADDIADKMKKSDFEFVKPKLKIKKTEKNVYGAYDPSSNIIVINANYLSPKKWRRLADNGVYLSKFNDGKNSMSDIFALSSQNNKNAENAVIPTLSELMMRYKSTLVHELEHSRQFQISFQADGAQDFILKILKEKNPQMSDDKIKHSSKFLFSFSPRKDFSLDTPVFMGDLSVTAPKDKKVNSQFFKLINSDGSENTYVPIYTPRMMMNELLGDYTYKDVDKYYGNLGEIFARRAEFDLASKGCFDGVDEEVVNTFKKVKKHNYKSLLNYTAFYKE